MDFYLLIFKNTADALNGEEKLNTEKIPHAVYPTPPQIIGSCGISLRFTEMELNSILDMIDILRESPVLTSAQVDALIEQLLSVLPKYIQAGLRLSS